MTDPNVISLRDPQGATATVDLLGARLLSWCPPGAADQLYTRGAERDCTEGLHGGVPLIFPQFAARGAGPFHGIVKNLKWQARMEQAAGVATLERRCGRTAWWDHDAQLTLRVALDGATLALALVVRNVGYRPLTFQAGLHTFLAASVQPTVRGLEHLHYVDHPGPEDRSLPPQGAPLVACPPLDRIFPAAPQVVLARADGALTIRQHGFANTIVWRPVDPDTGDGPPFLCIEPAQLADLELAPGASWTGTQTLTWLPAATA